MSSTSSLIRNPVSGLMVEAATCSCGRQFARTPLEWSPTLGHYTDMTYCPTCHADGTLWAIIRDAQGKGKRR